MLVGTVVRIIINKGLLYEGTENHEMRHSDSLDFYEGLVLKIYRCRSPYRPLSPPRPTEHFSIFVRAFA
jgi:hypothetical protein